MDCIIVWLIVAFMVFIVIKSLGTFSQMRRKKILRYYPPSSSSDDSEIEMVQISKKRD